jgi:hypothetical protein
VRIDNLVYLDGVDLTNPVNGFDPGLVWAAETLTVTGNYTQADGATLEIDIGGLGVDQYDVLEVGGTATLDGSLYISFANGFTPATGDFFPILNAAHVTGSLELTGESAEFTLLATETGRALYFGDLPPGDYDKSGTVEAADYDAWKAAFGSTVSTPGSGSDGNVDGVVDAADYTIWRNNLGASVFAGSGSGTSSTEVPEPIAIWLLATLGALRVPRRSSGWSKPLIRTERTGKCVDPVPITSGELRVVAGLRILKPRQR